MFQLIFQSLRRIEKYSIAWVFTLQHTLLARAYWPTKGWTKKFLLASTLAAAGLNLAHAAPVTWFLEGVKLSNEATATGSLVYDIDTNTYSNIDITTNNGGALKNYVALNPNFAHDRLRLGMLTQIIPSLSGEPSFRLAFSAPLNPTNFSTVLIETPPFLTSKETFCGNPTCTLDVGEFQYVIEGRVTRIPLSPPEIFASSQGSVEENQNLVGDILGFDTSDSEGSGLTFAITGGVDQARFTIDANTGVLSFVTPPDFENPADAGSDNKYNVQVTLADFGGLTNEINFTITVTDSPEEIWYLEGVKFDTGATATGSFVYNASTNTYSNINVDFTKNDITTTYRTLVPLHPGDASGVNMLQESLPDLTGHHRFNLLYASPLFNSSGTINLGSPATLTSGTRSECGNATCSFTLNVLDRVSAGRVTTLNISAPIINSNATTSLSENLNTAIDVQATDNADTEGAGLTFTLSGGADQALFNIDVNTGVVSFITSPDFENPADAGGNNQYDIQVTVTDFGGLAASQDITITVTDGVEITVSNATDVENAPDLSSVAALIANDGGDGISLREAITATNNVAGASAFINFSSLFDTVQTINLINSLSITTPWSLLVLAQTC